jgi:hypothetical protein
VACKQHCKLEPRNHSVWVFFTIQINPVKFKITADTVVNVWCLSPLKSWVRTSFMARCSRYNIMWYSLSVPCDRSVVSTTNKTDRHDIIEMLVMEFVIFAFLAVQLDYWNIQIRPAQYTIRNYWNRVGHQYSIQIYAFRLIKGVFFTNP